MASAVCTILICAVLSMVAASEQPLFEAAGFPSVLRSLAPGWQNLGGYCHHRPTAVATSTSELQVHCSTEGNLQSRKLLSGTTWSNWESTATTYFSYRNPSVVAHSNGDVDRFSVWQFYELVNERSVAGVWEDSWSRLAIVTSRNPLPLSLPTNDLALFVLADQNDIWYLYRMNGVWGSWYGMSGSMKFMSKPSGTVQPNGDIYLFARSSYGIVMINKVVNRVPKGWITSGKFSTCDPEVARYGSGFIVVICGQHGQLQFATYKVNLSAWVTVSGSHNGQPAVCATGRGRVHMFVRDASNQLVSNSMHKGYFSSSWKKIGVSEVASDPTCVVRGSEVHLFVVVKDNSLRHLIFK